MSGSSFADGVEFEETFAEPVAEVPAADASATLIQDKLERRLREAEALVKQTIERMRIEEERYLVEWVQDRRAEEERRLAKWVTERRAVLERSHEKRATDTDGLAERLHSMLADWEDRFDQRMQQRNAELEQALTVRFAQRQVAEHAPGLDRAADPRMSLGDKAAATTSARDLARLIRDAIAKFAQTSAFALSVHKSDRDEVAYRFRVASDDDLGALLRTDTLDDGPQSAAAHMDGWARGQRTMRVGSRNVTLHTAQLAVRTGDHTVGVVTLRTETDALDDGILARVRDQVMLCAPHLAALRDSGRVRSTSLS